MKQRILFSLSTALLAGAVCFLWFRLTLQQHIEVRTLSQVMLLMEIEKEGLNANSAPLAAKNLKDCVLLSPHFPKTSEASISERTVELVRSNSAANLIGHLKRLTGKDYGDDPSEWIKLLVK